MSVCWLGAVVASLGLWNVVGSGDPNYHTHHQSKDQCNGHPKHLKIALKYDIKGDHLLYGILTRSVDQDLCIDKFV